MTLPLFARDLPRYSVAVEDPEWPEHGGGNRGADVHYPTSTAEEIIARPIGDCMEADAHLWMWATDTHFPTALKAIEARGFKYVRTFSWVKVEMPPVFALFMLIRKASPWSVGILQALTKRLDALGYLVVKLQIGLGQYARGSHEHLILATRGKACVPPPERRPPSVILAPRTQHSSKPESAWAVIEAVSRPGLRVEFNARTARPGWDAVGLDSSGGTIEDFLRQYRGE